MVSLMTIDHNNRHFLSVFKRNMKNLASISFVLFACRFVIVLTSNTLKDHGNLYNLTKAAVQDFRYSSSRLNDDPSSDYPVFQQKITGTGKTTTYINTFNPKYIFSRHGVNDTGLDLVVDSEYLSAHTGLKDVTTLLVFKQITDKPTLYTAHMAHVLKLTDQGTVIHFEWEAFNPILISPNTTATGVIAGLTLYYGWRQLTIDSESGSEIMNLFQFKPSLLDLENNFIPAIRTDEQTSKPNCPGYADLLSDTSHENALSVGVHELDYMQAIFSGFGPCPFIKPSTNSKPTSGVFEVIMKFATILKLQCESRHVDSLVQLFDTGLLEMRHGLVKIAKTHPFHAAKTLTSVEWQIYGSSIAFSSFMDAYNYEEMNVENTSREQNTHSVSFHTMNLFGMKMLQNIQTFCPSHAIKMSKILRASLVSYVKRLGDEKKYLASTCSTDTLLEMDEINYFDHTRIVALIKFIRLNTAKLGSDPEFNVNSEYQKFLLVQSVGNS